jgi:UDP-N-acetylmuramoylalanine--D-glutamate ligase
MTVLTAMKDKQVLVLGLGLTGLSCVRFLHKHGLSFAVNDSRDMPFTDKSQQVAFTHEFINKPVNNLSYEGQVSLHTGSWQQDLIKNADVIIASPGIDLAKEGINQLIKENCQIMGDVELFCQINNEQAKPINILAVTGSNGKSTVVSLLAYLAKNLGINAQLGGNIGQPVLDLLSVVRDSQPKFLILELSSFQLETLQSMHAIAATVLNLSDDHLDRHNTFANYQAIKQSIYPQANLAVINRDDPATIPHLHNDEAVRNSISFGCSKPKNGDFGVDLVNLNDNKQWLMFGKTPLIAIDALPLAGMHNAMNYLAALALGKCAGWSLTAMVEKLAGFSGLEHRCQRINTSDGIQWINDSKATNVGATEAAITGLVKVLSPRGNNLILIAGGEGKGADFSPLKKLLTKQVSQVITLGKDGDEIASLTKNAISVNNLSEAIVAARNIASVGDMVLLSPACASLDMFKSFVDRGNQFMHLVQASQPKEVNDVVI